jgi:hypothetical protein
MPIYEEKDDKGCYYQWGNRGRKYYYEKGDRESRVKAWNQAVTQMKASYWRGYKSTDKKEKGRKIATNPKTGKKYGTNRKSSRQRSHLGLTSKKKCGPNKWKPSYRRSRLRLTKKKYSIKRRCCERFRSRFSLKRR